jgi:hypothetical protein
MADYLDYLMGLGETGATLGSGAAAGLLGMPYGVYKGATSGKLGTREANRIAEEEARKFMEQYTYQPRGDVAPEMLQSIGGLLESSKLPPVIPEVGMLASIPRQAYAAQAERAGMAAERKVAPMVERTMKKGGVGAGLLSDLAQGSRSQMLQGNNVFDPRFDPRVLEQERLRNLKTTVVPVQDYTVPEVSLANYEGYPFITSMADRTRTGLLTDIDGVLLNRPVELQGGQPYMFENPGQVWASGKKPATDIYNLAKELKSGTGQDPLFLPWVMSPSGSDFANMTGETMLAYAQSAMSSGTKKALDSQIKNKFIPNWKGIDDPASIAQFKQLSDKKRKSMKKQLLDKEFRNEGGLSLGEARLAIADPTQLTSQDATILNVGQVFPDRPIITQSGHSSYPLGVPGQGLGVSKDKLNIFQLLKDYSASRGIKDPTAPSRPDIRTLEMKPYGGILTSDVLKSLGY